MQKIWTFYVKDQGTLIIRNEYNPSVESGYVLGRLSLKKSYPYYKIIFLLSKDTELLMLKCNRLGISHYNFTLKMQS